MAISWPNLGPILLAQHVCCIQVTAYTTLVVRKDTKHAHPDNRMRKPNSSEYFIDINMTQRNGLHSQQLAFFPIF